MDTTDAILNSTSNNVPWSAVFVYVVSGLVVAVVALVLHIKKLYKRLEETSERVITVIINNTNVMKALKREQKDLTTKIAIALPVKQNKRK